MKRIKKVGIGLLIITSAIWSKPSVDPLRKSILKHSEKPQIKKKHGETDIVFKRSSKTAKQVVRTAKKYLGTRYRFGASTRTTKRFDCSSFTKHVIKKAKGKNIPRTARAQASIGKHINKRNLKPGDLVFFQGTSSHAKISHVGIMISKTQFIHASSGARKVTISSLNKPYYKKKYFGARRV